MRLRIDSLGAFGVYRGNEPLSPAAWKTQKNKTLLKILLTYRRPTLTKEQLMEWLWPDLDPAAADRNLRVAVSQLREALEPELPHGARSSFILTTESGYAWDTNSDYWLDADEFQARCAQFEDEALTPESRLAHAERARNLYRGDYLEQDRYADWAAARREQLREMFFCLLTGMAEAYAGQGRFERAASLCHEILAADRCRESVWRQLMLYHYHAGDQGRALRDYEACKQILAEELGVEPMAETAQLMDQIRRHEIAGERSYPPPGALERLRRLPFSLGRIPFVGREREYAYLVDQLEQVRAGAGRFVLIEGEAGVGKSRLVEEVLGYARQQGATVLEARCRKAESATPQKPIVDALRSAFQVEVLRAMGLSANLAAALAELWPELKGPPAPPARPRLSPELEKLELLKALVQLLAALAGKNPPLVLFLDDLQWADASTLEFLDYVAANPGRLPALIIGACRTEEVEGREAGPLARWLYKQKRRDLLQRRALDGLSAEAVTRLVQELSGSADQALSLGPRLYQETEGNPLFFVLLLQALFEEGWLRVNPAGQWSAKQDLLEPRGRPPVPLTVQALILDRLKRLEPEERRVLEAASVLGCEFQFTLLGCLRAWRQDILLDHLDRLEGALLIREQPQQTYLFTHGTIREVVYQGVDEEQRAWLHRKAGEALEGLYADHVDEVAGLLAHHFQHGRSVERAFAYRLRAGQQAARLYANLEAMDHYGAALGLLGQDSFAPAAETVREIHEKLGELYQANGQYALAQSEFEAALAVTGAAGDRVRLLYKLAHNYDRQGQRDLALEFFGQAVARLESREPAAAGALEAAKIYARWAIFTSPQRGVRHARRYARKALALLDKHLPEGRQGARVLAWVEYETVGSVLVNAGEAFRYWERWSEAAALFRQYLAVAERQADPIGIGYASHNLGDVALAQGDPAQARALYERAAEAFARSGQAWEEMASWTHLGIAWACEAQWPQAAQAWERARRIGDKIEPTYWLAQVYAWLALAELRVGQDGARAGQFRERAAEVAGSVGRSAPSALWQLALAEAEAQAGRVEAAREHWKQARSLLSKDQEAAVYRGWILPQFDPGFASNP